MTNLALLHPASSSVGARWLFDHRNTESWRLLTDLQTESEMPDSSTSKSSTSNSSKGKRPIPREKVKKYSEERNNNDSSPEQTLVSNNIKQEQTSSRESSKAPSNNSQSESGSPNQSRVPSPTTSPKSPSSSSRHNRTPSSSVAGTPPHPSFTPPTSITPACFSPASMGGLGAIAASGLPNPLGAMGIFNGAHNLPDGVRNMANAVPRNCSDLMRSMAAKYNNNSSPANPVLPFYNNTVLNGFPRPPLPPAGGFPNAGFLPGLPNESSSSPVQPTRDNNVKTSENSIIKRPASGTIQSGLPPHLLSPGNFPGLPTNPLMDLSSTQVLINMVRNASNIHQTHLQKAQNDFHSQHQYQKQLLYQQQLQQQQQQQAQASIHHQHLKEQQTTYKQLLQNSSPNRQDDQRTNAKPVDHTVGSNSSNDIGHHRTGVKRQAEAASPLDLSATVPSKHLRATTEADINVEDDEVSVPHASPDTPNSSSLMKSEINSSTVMQKMRFDEKEDTTTWTVDDVFDFVRSIDICSEYAENFREQRIDGACLLLLSESHLTDSLKMKLGPALKLRSFLANRAHQRQNYPLHHNNNYHQAPLSPSCRPCNHCTSCNTNAINNNNNGDHICKKLSYTESVGTDMSSPRLSVVSPVHTTKSLSPPHQLMENASSPSSVDGRPMVADVSSPQ